MRIPREFRIDGQEVEIFRRGVDLTLPEPAKSPAQAFELFGSLSGDFFKGGRKQPKARKRPAL